MLNSPFTSDPFTPPKPHDGENDDNHYDTAGLNKPCSGGVLGFKTYEDAECLKGSPAALASPMGTAIEGIGKGFTGKN